MLGFAPHTAGFAASPPRTLGLPAPTARTAQLVSLGRWLGRLMNCPPPATQPSSCGPQIQRPPGGCPTRGSRLRSALQARREIFQSDFILYSAFLSQSKGTWQVENSHLSDCVNLLWGFPKPTPGGSKTA